MLFVVIIYIQSIEYDNSLLAGLCGHLRSPQLPLTTTSHHSSLSPCLPHLLRFPSQPHQDLQHQKGYHGRFPLSNSLHAVVGILQRQSFSLLHPFTAEQRWQNIHNVAAETRRAE